MRVVLVNNVSQYAGPGTVSALLQDGYKVICHDASFTDNGDRLAFERQYPGAYALTAQSPEEIYAQVNAEWGTPDAIVCNDVFPIARTAIENISIQSLQETFAAVVVNPIRITQLFLPGMKARHSGAFVFVTSAREYRPEPGFAVPTSMRAAATAFAKALAKEVACFGIQANVVAPNYLYSELYYPRSHYIDDPAGRADIEARVPFGRLGTQEEVGALISFLASGKSPFTTGQVICFTGGWSS